MNIGVWACDPGGATGVAWAILNPHAKGGAGPALLSKQHAGSATINGDPRTQIREIAAIWQAFYRACVNDALLPPDKVFIVMEDFVYKPGTVYGGDDSKISTALIWGLEGYRMGRRDEWSESHRGSPVMPTMFLQTASQAKSHVTNARLKEWGLWVVGRDHERSAWQHVGHFLARYIQQHV